MTRCPICGYIYDLIYNVVQPSVCLVCQVEIVAVPFRLKQKKQDKKIWRENISRVHEEMIPVILHPDRIDWFFPDHEKILSITTIK